jgi:flagellar M-ring protein FliF
LLEQSVGSGNARAEVSADIGFDRIVKNSEVYDPNGQVVRSVKTSEAKEFSNDGDSGNVSVGNNLPDALPAAGAADSAGSGSERTEETTNFEISRTVTNHVSEIGVIKKISVAVLVDGTYTVNEETQERTYQPRSEEEIEKLRTLVKSAMGFDEKRGDLIEVVNMPFSRENFDEKESTDPFEWLKRDLHNILKTLVIGVVAVLVIMLVIRPMVNRAFEIAPVEEQAMSAPLGGGGGGGEGINAAMGGEEEPTFEIEQIQSRMKLSTSKKVNELANSNPEETLNILRNWMTQK